MEAAEIGVTPAFCKIFPHQPLCPKEPFVMCPLWSARCDADLGEGKCSLATSTREEKPSLVKVSSLHTNLHVSFLQRRERVFHRHQARVKAAACPRSPVADDPSALPPPTCSPSSSQELLLCPLDASLCSPAVVLYYCALRDTILKDFKYFLYFLCLLVFYVLFV